jgi:hydroxyethylthiazole kinase
MATTAEKAARDLARVREKCPLIHNITNYVVMHYTANALLALGASPVMAHAVEEMEEMASLADTLVLNIGTLSTPWIEAMIVAGTAASRRGIPIILDPVGAGATALRTATAVRLVDECKVTVLRGNASAVPEGWMRHTGSKTRPRRHASGLVAGPLSWPSRGRWTM